MDDEFINNSMMQSVDKFSGGRGNVRVYVDNRVTNNFNTAHPDVMSMMIRQNRMVNIMQNMMQNMVLTATPYMNGMGALPMSNNKEIGYDNDMHHTGITELDSIEYNENVENDFVMNDYEEVIKTTDPVNNKYYITNTVNKIYKEPNNMHGQHMLAKLVIPDDPEEPITIFTLNTNMITNAKKELTDSSYLKVDMNSEWNNEWFKELIIQVYSILKRTGRNYAFLVEETAEITDLKYPINSKVYSNHSLLSSNVYVVEFRKVTDTVIFNF